MSSIMTPALQLLDDGWQIVQETAVSGGCISQAARLQLRNDDREWTVFAKSNDAEFEDNFRCEAEGLRALRSACSADVNLRVPEPIVVGVVGKFAFLISEWVDLASGSSSEFKSFGQALARLHLATRGDAVGWHRDNYLGGSRQINAGDRNWSPFVAENRLAIQLNWAREQGLASPRLGKDVESICRRIDSILQGREEQTSLLHGDLWSGNYQFAADGTATILDPAVYRGCREAEFGMIELFGSCPPAFYQGYQGEWPLPSGWQRRVSVYVLYHLLNHLNLFGSGYLGQCERLAGQISRS
ncbi:MAG: fructosamine kinase family protein [Planctomycetota bacterium]